MTYDWDLSKLGFGNEPAWTPGCLSRFEERACWLQKVWCLDSQVQSLEAASFFGRAAKQHDGALQQLQSCVQIPLLAAGRAGPAEGAVSSPPEARGEQKAAALIAARQETTTGARTRGEPSLLQKSPRPKPAVQHGTLRQPEKTEPKPVSTRGKKWKWSADHEDPEESLEEPSSSKSSKPENTAETEALTKKPPAPGKTSKARSKTVEPRMHAEPGPVPVSSILELPQPGVRVRNQSQLLLILPWSYLCMQSQSQFL